MKHTYVIILWLCLMVFGSVAAQGQEANRIAKALKSKTNQRSEEAIPVFDLFDAKEPSNSQARHADLLEKGTVMQMRVPDVQRMLRLQPDLIQLTLPFQESVIDLVLFHQAPTSESIIAKSSDGQIETPQGVHYRGIVKGDEQSIASVSIFDNEIIGIVSCTDLGNVVIGKIDVDGEHIIYQEEHLLIDNNAGCETLEVPGVTRQKTSQIDNHQRSAAECVQIYFETSFSLFQNKGSFAAVQNYVTGLFNNVATLYANEGLNVEISEIFIWTSADPFQHSSSSGALSSFISERPNFNGTLGHLLDISGRNNGGLAYVDVLCDNTYNVGYSDIHGSYNNVPTYSWTVNVVAHELGHNFGSDHTHDCSWGPQNCTAIDGCGNPNPNNGCGSCADAPIPPKGTIMSYCHVGGNGIDFNLGFGPEPGALMRANASAANCLPQCGSGNGGGGCTIFIDNVIVTDATCSDNNGKLVIQTSGGSGSVTYDIGNGQQSSNTFDNLLAGTYQITVVNGAGCERSQEATIQLLSTQPGLGATVTNATCGQDDGVVELAASGGESPYSYRIGSKTQSSPTFNSLAVGNYTATITDNKGCGESKQFSIFTDNPPALSTSMNHTSCGEANGSVNLSADGGQGPYTYKLGAETSSNGQFDNIAAGNYQVEVIDGNGCIDDQSITINASQPIAASANVVDTECGQENGEVVISASGGTGSLTFSKGGSFQSVPTFSNLAAGTYQLKVKDATGCVHTFDQQVAPSESFALMPVVERTRCGLDNGSIDIQVDGNTGPYEYSLDQGTFKSSPSFASLSAGVVTIAARDADGCIVEDEIEVGASTRPKPIALIDRTHCGLDNGSISLTVEGGLGPFQFGLDDQFQTDTAFLGLAAGEYTIAVRDADECQDSIELVIDSSEAVKADLILTHTACGMPNGGVEFMALSGEGPFAFAVGEVISDQNVIGELAAGKYSVKIADADQCGWFDTIAIEASNAIALEADLTMTTCGRDNGSIEFLASGGTGQLLFSLLDTTFSKKALYQSLPAATYTMQVQDDEGCILENEVIILPSTNPVLDFAVNHTRCGGDNGMLNLNVTDGEGPFQFQVNQIMQDKSILTDLAPGAYELSVLDLHGCVDTILAIVETSTAPILSLETTPASCYQINGQITVEGILGVGPYQYSIGQDLYQSGINFSGVDSGQYVVVLIDQRACTDTIVTNVAYDDQYQAPELPDATSICESDPAVLDIGLSKAPSIVWTRDNSPLSHTEPSLTTDVPGDYQVVVRYHDDCILKTNTQLDVRSKPQQTLVTADTICLGELFTIGQPNESLTYQWSDDSEGSSVAFTTSDVYELTVINRFDCSISKQLNMTVIQPVSLEVDSDTSYICLGEGFQWNLTGADHYQWLTTDPTIDRTNIANPNVNPSNDQSYQVIGQNQCFEGSIDLSLLIYQDIVKHLEDTTVVEGSPLRFFVDDKAVSANWSSPFELKCPDCIETIGRPDISGMVDVIYLDVNGCEFRDTIEVDIIPLESVFPPLINVITPNEDGLNDVLAFEGMDVFRQYKLEVFNQDGNIIYTNKDYKNNWNGTLDGKPLPEGVYFYIISVHIDDRIFQFDSDVTIVRD